MDFQILHARADGMVIDGAGTLQLDAHGLHADIAMVTPLLRHIRDGGKLDDKFQSLLPSLSELLDKPLYEVLIAEIAFPAASDTVPVSRKQAVAISKCTDSVRALVSAISALSLKH